MITQFVLETLISLWESIFETIVDTIPDIPEIPDDWVSGAQDVGVRVAEANNVLPIDFALVCLAAIASFVLVGIAIRVVRIVVSLFTAGGGSAA